MKPKCIFCDEELKLNTFKGCTPNIYFFECQANNGHSFSFDFNLINKVYYPKSFYYAKKKSHWIYTILIFELFINDNQDIVCRIKDTNDLELIIDKIIIEDIFNKFINNQLTIEHINFLINRLKDLALFI